MAFPIPSPFVWDASFDVGSAVINDQVSWGGSCAFSRRTPHKSTTFPSQHKKLFTLITDLEADQGNAAKLTVSVKVKCPFSTHCKLYRGPLTVHAVTHCDVSTPLPFLL